MAGVSGGVSRRNDARAIGRPKSDGEKVGEQALIEATCDLLKVMPPRKMTRAVVAREAGVDPSLIRYYFKNVDGLLIAAAARISALYAERVQREMEQAGPDVTARIRVRIRSMLELLAEYPYFQRLIAENILESKDTKPREILDNMLQRGVGSYAEMLAEGAEEGKVRPVDPQLLFFAVIGLAEFQVTAASILQRRAPGGPTDSKFEKEYKEFMCDLLMGSLLTDTER